MAQTQATTTTTTETSTNGTGKAKTKQQPAIEAIKKISNILDQLTTADRKRVLAFVNESENSGNGE